MSVQVQEVPATAADVRERIIAAMARDLVGPTDDAPELLPYAPGQWYLTGYLVPMKGQRDVTKRSDPQAPAGEGGLEAEAEVADAVAAGGDVPEGVPRRPGRLPSSIGLSLLLQPGASTLTLEVSWADYTPEQAEGADTPHRLVWRRAYQTRELPLKLTAEPRGQQDVPGSNGLVIRWARRPFTSTGSGLPDETQAVALFLVNERSTDAETPSQERDRDAAFQARLCVRSEEGFLPRPDWSGRGSSDVDRQIADLQYRDEREWAVGHGIATTALLDEDCVCRQLATAWIPEADIEKVEPADVPGVFGMEVLAATTEHKVLATMLEPMVMAYRTWIDDQRALPLDHQVQRDIRDRLAAEMEDVAERIGKGIQALAQDDVREAFTTANAAMARAARQRKAFEKPGTRPEDVAPPTWRPFQLAFFLMGIPGIADPTLADREEVDLLFFPTGGGKTEAYLGLAAFTMVLRRLRNPATSGAGVSVLMRYTLRLLTLDQLGRAATLICALELARQASPERLGTWPFEIGLWVGQGATPNRMGKAGEANNEKTAWIRTLRYKKAPTRFSAPLPIATCPWCNATITKDAFVFFPKDEPRRLRVACQSRGCPFRGRADNPDAGLPLIGVDEEVYRRLPAFLIATVDKFASLPWEGRAGTLFGAVDRADGTGFYGPCDPGYGSPLPGGRLLPPDLVIQDELHLISGPLGTMAGLYEAAIERLGCRALDDGKLVRPKIVASTATVRRAASQIQALFGREQVTVFPPPGPDRRDSYFAITRTVDKVPGRRYVGVAARGRSAKVALLRTAVALMAAAQREYERAGGATNPDNPADPYMTLLGYFSSLRELGGSRRIFEDEVKSRLAGQGEKLREGEVKGQTPFANRTIGEVGELTSRVPTAVIADTKAALARVFDPQMPADVALATNMISVGLDIVRLGLMVVNAQPKSTAEYIQASSRVGRDAKRPGLVVVVYNVNRPRDRSHYERFAYFHTTFYRAVETSSVTPWSMRALDRGLPGMVVGLARHCFLPMTPPKGAIAADSMRSMLSQLTPGLAARAAHHSRELGDVEVARLQHEVTRRVEDLFDDWAGVADHLSKVNAPLQYGHELKGRKGLLRQPLEKPDFDLGPKAGKFKANRSLRDVEPTVNVFVKRIGENAILEGDDE